MEIRLENTRVAVRDALIELAGEDKKYVLVCSDSSLVVKAGEFIERFPDRYIDLGIAEQSAVNVAAGLASTGLVPFLVTYAGFITMRACEQVRSFVCYPDLNVKLVGANGGMASGEREGPSHQFFEDIGILRTFPRMTICVPSNARQVKDAVKAVAGVHGPAFIRIGSGRDAACDIPGRPPFELGKAQVLVENGTDVALFTMGFVLPRVMEACEKLKEEGINATVVEVSTIKPLDSELVAEVCDKTKAAVTIEDHQVNCALGSAVAEVIAEKAPARLVRLGLQDVFPESGMPDELLDKYKIGVIDIMEAAKGVIANKQA
jgi:transketolase